MRRRVRAAALAALVATSWLACSAFREEPPARPFDFEMIDEGPGGRRALELLSRDFYQRISNRRFNSIATYQDPALREFFRSERAWSDYYADLVQSLEDHDFESVRPTQIDVLGIDLGEAGGGEEAEGQGGENTVPAGTPTALIRLRFVGEDGRPLRWWRTRFLREDRWVRLDGRWWILPGKV